MVFEWGSFTIGSGRVKKVQRLKTVHRNLSYLNSHQVIWYHFLHQVKNLCQNPLSHWGPGFKYQRYRCPFFTRCTFFTRPDPTHALFQQLSNGCKPNAARCCDWSIKGLVRWVQLSSVDDKYSTGSWHTTTRPFWRKSRHMGSIFAIPMRVPVMITPRNNMSLYFDQVTNTFF